MTRILIVEDEPRIVEFLERGLAANGYATVIARDGRDALTATMRDDLDLIILDIGLPDVDGLAVLRALRGQGSTTPVLVLTARGGIEDTVTGLDAGADDYVTKPFRFEELLARVRARLRAGPSTHPGAPTELRAGRVTLDLRTRRATVGERGSDLSARESAMLEALMRRAGEVVSREELLSEVWGYGHDPGSNVVDVYVGYLRRKLGDDLVTTVRGMGYRLDAG